VPFFCRAERPSTKRSTGVVHAEPRNCPDLLPLGTDDAGPLGLESFATHRLPLEEVPQACADFQGKRNGTVKVLFKPELRAPPSGARNPAPAATAATLLVLYGDGRARGS
jgi:hypothetical protein